MQLKSGTWDKCKTYFVAIELGATLVLGFFGATAFLLTTFFFPVIFMERGGSGPNMVIWPWSEACPAACGSEGLASNHNIVGARFGAPGCCITFSLNRPSSGGRLSLFRGFRFAGDFRFDVTSTGRGGGRPEGGIGSSSSISWSS